jgi:indole-3-glycerol phosphate synthase
MGTDADLGTACFLEAMVEQARLRVAETRRLRPLSRPVPAVAPAGGPSSTGRLIAALTRGSCGCLALIAEVKRRSPSRGAIAPTLDAAARARAYQAAGADAVSVLTEPTRFGGSLDDLNIVARAVTVPVLRKDFIIDSFQIWEAAHSGAAAVLLIVAALSDDELCGLLDECGACGLDALVEVHDETELGRALAAGARLVGINNRDLRTLAVDLGVTERLAAGLNEGVLVVSESGIVTGADARRVATAGVRALLVGEALVSAPSGRLEVLVGELKGAAPAVGEGWAAGKGEP